MSRQLWDKMLREAMYRNIAPFEADAIYYNTVVAWGEGSKYYYQNGPTPVDLTDLYEKYKLILALKGDYDVSETN